MSDNKNLSSADAQILGTLFQIERTLYWLALIKDEESFVCLEVDDDVSVRLANGESIQNIFEQNKSSVSKINRNPLSNTSINLWKTISNWTNLILDQNIDIKKSKFLFVTNVTIPDSALIKKISKESDANTKTKHIEDLLGFAKRSANNDITGYFKNISRLSDKQQKDLFDRIELIDNPKYITDRNLIKKEVREHLKIGSKIPFNSFYRDVLGWLQDIAIERWTQKESVLIRIKDFNNYINENAAKYLKKTFIEQQESLLPVTDAQRSENKNENFVKQLTWIECDEVEIISAIDDFLRAGWERKRYALNHNKPSISDFAVFEDALSKRWKGEFFDAKSRVSTPESKILLGKSVYFKVVSKSEYLSGQLTEQNYTVSGTYQKLANQFKLGWHIDYLELKDKS